ncbi:Maf family protein [Portibacter marinus]|uniref:Maf family protein n=1 Tax=Portibacter marinus TaxID=2898660 RepID=UPI001F264CAB|nr:Maf family protein [Portibacter marinus]
MHKIYLASKSPRRREIIENAGFPYELVEVDVEETFPESLDREEVAEYLALKKAEAVTEIPDDGILLTSDTIVICKKEILGKPIDKSDARRMLSKLSGEKHVVITGVCLKDRKKQVNFSDVSEVFFHELTNQEIENYISTSAPYDKAGSYGIQDGLGMVAVDKISGSYFNIMGLPIHRVYQIIKNWDD